MAVTAPAHLKTLADVQSTRRAEQKWAMASRRDEKADDTHADKTQLDIWRAKVYRRDKDRCRCCKVKVDHVFAPYSDRAEAHHIKARSHRPTRYDIRNGLTLCHDCHQRVTGRVSDKLRVVASKWFMLDGVKYINGSAPVTFQKVA